MMYAVYAFQDGDELHDENVIVSMTRAEAERLMRANAFPGNDFANRQLWDALHEVGIRAPLQPN